MKADAISRETLSLGLAGAMLLIRKLAGAKTLVKAQSQRQEGEKVTAARSGYTLDLGQSLG